jgi:uncharacterized protein YodC (DUF2158 family)
MVQALKAGDIVRLKSGSPRMMLTSVDDRGYVRTAWAVGTDTRHGDFHLDALLGAPAEAPSDPRSDDRAETRADVVDNKIYSWTTVS